MLSIAPDLLTTQRLILRPWRESERDEFARLNGDPVVMEFMPRRLSRDESDDVARRIQASIEERGWGFWAVEVKGGDARVADGGVAVRAAGEGVGAGAVADGGAARGAAFIGLVGSASRG